MLTSLILTVVVLVCLSILGRVIDSAPFLNSNMKWVAQAVIALMAVVLILDVWKIVRII